jgi:hypothetical protein
MPIESPDAPAPAPGPAGLEEFRALRATVGTRGSLRVLVSFLTFVSWAGLATIVALTGAAPIVTLLPLAILWVGFELIAGLHIGVERIGRYLRVFHEGPAAMPKWETAIALFGQSDAAKVTRVRPLLEPEFVGAALVNVGLPVWARAAVLLPGPVLRPDLAVALVAHAALVWRVRQVSRQTRRQRDLDESAFQGVARNLGR